MADMRRFLDLTGLGIYDEKIKAVIATGDANALAEAKKYFDDNKGLFEAAGSVKTAKEALQAAIDAVDAKVIAIANGAAINDFAGVEAALAGKQAAGDYATKAEAQAMADGKDAAIAAAKKAGDDAQGAIDAYMLTNDEAVANLTAYVGTIPEGSEAANIVAYVQEKTSGIATEGAMTELNGRVGVVEGKVATIEGDYLKGEDKTELEGKITAVETAVATEKSRAEGIEAGLRTDVDAIKGDYLKGADKTALQDQITVNANAIERLTNGVSADEIDGVNDLINYVKEHGPEVTGMKEDISENAQAIAGVAGSMDTAEGKITVLEGAVATKVEQEAYDAKIAELAGADSAMAAKIAALEAKHGDGEGTVESLIATAKQEAIDAAASDAAAKDEALEAKITTAYKKYADEEDAKIETRVDALEAASANHALKSEVEAVAGRATTLEGKVEVLEGEMDGVQAAVATKAEAADLTALAGRVTTVEGKVGTLETEMDSVESRLDDAEDAIEGKAEASVVEALATRVGTAETNISANAAALAKFVEITPAEINSLFAQ